MPAAEIEANSLELRRPRRQRIGPLAVEHVAHGERQRIQIVLNAEKLQGILAITVGEVGLKNAKPGNLPGHIPGIDQDGRQRDDQSDQQPSRGR